jgi:hypothetical protein
LFISVHSKIGRNIDGIPNKLAKENKKEELCEHEQYRTNNTFAFGHSAKHRKIEKHQEQNGPGCLLGRNEKKPGAKRPTIWARDPPLAHAKTHRYKCTATDRKIDGDAPCIAGDGGSRRCCFSLLESAGSSAFRWWRRRMGRTCEEVNSAGERWRRERSETTTLVAEGHI